MGGFYTTIVDDNTSTETPNLRLNKSKDSSSNTLVNSSTTTTTNSKIPNTPPMIKQKFPKLPVIAGKPFK